MRMPSAPAETLLATWTGKLVVTNLEGAGASKVNKAIDFRCVSIEEFEACCHPPTVKYKGASEPNEEEALNQIAVSDIHSELSELVHPSLPCPL